MSARHVRPEDIAVVEEPADALRLRAMVTAADTAGALSATWVQLDGRHRRLRAVRTPRAYLVLTGRVTFRAGDAAEVAVGAGEWFVIDRGTPYELAGTATYVVVNAPAFADGDDEYLDPEGST